VRPTVPEAPAAKKLAVSTLTVLLSVYRLAAMTSLFSSVKYTGVQRAGVIGVARALRGGYLSIIPEAVDPIAGR